MSSPVQPPLASQPGREAGLFLGVDGGGTKTLAVITDESHRVLGEGKAGPGNPLRVGVAAAAANVEEAIRGACAAAGVERENLTAARIGLAGVRQADIRRQMREALAHLNLAETEILTDARIALYGATGGRPGLVIIAGTGSICCGVNERGRHACAGGWGPVAGDEGSGVWIARRALQLVAQAADGRGVETALTEAAYRYFQTSTSDELRAAIYAPDMTHDRIAGFGREVVATAQAGDAAAREIIAAAGNDLGLMAASVVRRLGMQGERFQVAYVGGVFSSGEMLLGPLRAELERAAPQAYLASPLYPPAVAAAIMAQQNRPRLALAG